MNERIKIGVLFGGQSGEHEVSRVSAYNILQAIDREKYQVVPIGISKDGQWRIYTGSEENIPSGAWEQDQAHLTLCLDLFKDLADVDLFFPVLHGPMGEDGTIQGVFEVLDKPYVGCGVLASAAGMDKVIAKILFRNAGIPVAPGIHFASRQWQQDSQTLVNRIEGELGYPAFVKPVNMGSSVGVTKAHNREELVAGIDNACAFDTKILVEAFINGREIECAVLETEAGWEATVPGEIVASKEFYDYEAKYSDDEDSEIIIPADLPAEAVAQIRDYAVKAVQAIDGSGLSRVDFFYTRDSGRVLINEINTMPGFTNISMYPKMWANMGLSYTDLVEHLIRGAARKRLLDYIEK